MAFEVVEPPVVPDFDILLSLSPDKSGAVPLNGETVSGEIFVFTNTDDSVEGVTFFIDGELIRMERVAPHDLAGTVRGDGTGLERDARPFDSSDLEDGEHEMVVEIDLNNANGVVVLGVDFEVANNAN